MLIYKKIFLYITIFISLIFIASIDSLSNTGLTIGTLIILALLYMCRKLKVVFI